MVAIDLATLSEPMFVHIGTSPMGFVPPAHEPMNILCSDEGVSSLHHKHEDPKMRPVVADETCLERCVASERAENAYVSAVSAFYQALGVPLAPQVWANKNAFSCAEEISKPPGLDCEVSTTASTSGAGSEASRSRTGSEVGSDDVGSWTELASGMSGPPGLFASPHTWAAPSPSSCQILVAAASPTFNMDCQPTSEGDDTTVIVRKVPCDVSRADFLDTLDAEGFARMYTFVYLPMNFQKGVGLGYAIVNFADAASAAEAALRLSSVELGGKQLQASISDERQSLSDLILRYRDSAVMHSSVPDDRKPVLFSDGLMVPFPDPTKTLDPPVLTKPKKSARKSARSMSSLEM